jgi:hypothetical protein
LIEAMLLIWLAWGGTLGEASAENGDSLRLSLHSHPDNGIQFSLAPSADPFGDPDPKGPYRDDPAGRDAPPPRADLYTLTKLAVDELEFLAGIRLIWSRTERRFDHLAQKLKLKGDIAIGGSAPSSNGGGGQIDRFTRYPLAARSGSPRSPLSLKSVFIPHKIKWRMGFDPTDRVAFGTLQWGHFIALHSDMGAHREVKVVFQVPF